MKKLIINFVMVFALAFSIGNMVAVGYADGSTDEAKKSVCAGIAVSTSGNCNSGGAGLSSIIKTLLNVLSIIAGLAAVIMIIVGGLKYITSGGDSSAVSGAKRTLIYAVVGLVVVAFSQFIVRYVINAI